MYNSFVWKDSFNTGFSIIDIQHKELFSRIDALTLSIYNGESLAQLHSLMKFLDEYIIAHFETEEDLLRKSKYTHTTKHIGLHKAFAESFQLLKSDFYSKGADNYMAMRIEKEVQHWWHEHVLGADRMYVKEVQHFLEKNPEYGKPREDFI
jgi:hemerythrin